MSSRKSPQRPDPTPAPMTRQEKQNRYLRRSECLELAVELWKRRSMPVTPRIGGLELIDRIGDITDTADLFERWLMKEQEPTP